MGSVVPFNPLDKINPAGSIENALSTIEAQPLSKLEPFTGSGVYSLYYVGDYAAYDPLSKINQEQVCVPIYVGKADSKGKRKGGFINSEAMGDALYKRLLDHAKSISQASNISIDDFLCRYLVVDDLWISLGESLLISKYSPVWNALIDGFGNHDPGSGRYSGMRPRWDTLHPGRPWTDKLKPNTASAELITAEVWEYLTSRYSVVSGFFGSSNYSVIDLE